mmetsp:Transcript_97104/g.167433  ORF Transcript_97104/g.167433 Transcript_97104/m.167433 type:complete len:92 (+) Transcript_97104:162-437(+)
MHTQSFVFVIFKCHIFFSSALTSAGVRPTDLRVLREGPPAPYNDVPFLADCPVICQPLSCFPFYATHFCRCIPCNYYMLHGMLSTLNITMR